MVPNRLRVYYGPDEMGGDTTATLPVREAQTLPMRDAVTLPLGEVLPLLLDAVKGRRQWINDFSDDEISISSDLYEVLLAYQHFRRPSA